MSKRLSSLASASEIPQSPALREGPISADFLCSRRFFIARLPPDFLRLVSLSRPISSSIPEAKRICVYVRAPTVSSLVPGLNVSPQITYTSSTYRFLVGIAATKSGLITVDIGTSQRYAYCRNRDSSPLRHGSGSNEERILWL